MKFRIALVGLFLSLAMAHAQPTNLNCTYENGASTHPFTFDEEAGSASFDNQPTSRATFTGTQITWENTDGSADLWYTVNRTTGELLERARGKKSGNQATFRYNCSVAQKKF